MSEAARDRGESRIAAILGAAASLVTILAFVGVQLDLIGGGDEPDRRAAVNPAASATPTPGRPAVPSQPPRLQLSAGRGPSGTRVEVRGSGFEPGDEVQLSFHIEEVGRARADAAGRFVVTITIPGSYDAFAPQQFQIVADGLGAVTHATIPFQLTAR